MRGTIGKWNWIFPSQRGHDNVIEWPSWNGQDGQRVESIIYFPVPCWFCSGTIRSFIYLFSARKGKENIFLLQVLYGLFQFSSEIAVWSACVDWMWYCEGGFIKEGNKLHPLVLCNFAVVSDAWNVFIWGYRTDEEEEEEQSCIYWSKNESSEYLMNLLLRFAILLGNNNSNHVSLIEGMTQQTARERRVNLLLRGRSSQVMITKYGFCARCSTRCGY